MSLDAVSVDFETYSTVDLRKQGVYMYGTSPDTGIWCMAYSFGGDNDVHLWTPADPFPQRLAEHVELGKPLRAYNATFERVIWNLILTPRHGAPRTSLEQWYCTAAEARAMALPRPLMKCARALNIKQRKDAGGAEVMKSLTKPQEETPPAAKLAALYSYCMQDVRVERAVAERVRRLSDDERRVYLMDQRMNDRGVRIDLHLVDALTDVVEVATDEGNQRLSEITDGEVTKVTQVQRLTAWAQDEGADIDNLRKRTVEEAVKEEDMPDYVQEALQLRLSLGRTSAGKLQAMKRTVYHGDQRARGLHLYHGASTGRWSGMLIQPQNFPRGTVSDPEQYIDLVYDASLEGRWPDYEDVPEPLDVVTSLLRGCMEAAPGHRLMGGDYAQIEARVLGWIAGEPFGNLEYERMAAEIFRVPVEEIVAEHAEGKSDRRKLGKDTVLGCGFQMGSGAFRKQAWERSGLRVSEALSERAVDTFRSVKAGIPRFWQDIETATREAIESPGSITTVGEGASIRLTVRNQFLWLILPSGRPLAYALPRMEVRDTPWGPRLQITYMGVDSYTKQWKRLTSYGGHLTENVVQAAARDILAYAMCELEGKTYDPILTVHDEVVCEVPKDGPHTLEEFTRILSTPPAWATLDIEVESWEGRRFRK